MKNIAVIGAGTMGNGIAHTFAQAGFRVLLIDKNTDQLQKSLSTITNNLDRLIKKGSITENEKQKTINNIVFQSDISNLDNITIAIEAVFESFEVKKNVIKAISEKVSNTTIIASNTSSISITKLGSTIPNPSRFIGMHFMNPVPIMPLVEIIRGYETNIGTCDLIENVTKQLGKTPIVVNDFPGFVANRILMPMINEAVITLQEGVAGVEEIDAIMKLGMSHPMGPLQLADFIGLDICLNILKVLYEGLGNPKYFPSPLLISMVEAGKLGAKTGEGFYIWSKETKNLIISPRFK
jgi:3-hydroxybutyryl-CoA dehydrogenase